MGRTATIAAIALALACTGPEHASDRAPGQIVAPDPTALWTDVEATTPDELRAQLHELIDNHVRAPYTASATDTWDILEQADELAGDPGRIATLYHNSVHRKVGNGSGGYSREHVWPKSFGFPDDRADNYPFTDCHALFLADTDYNAARANRPFDTCSGSCDAFAVIGGGENRASGFNQHGRWEAWLGRRGDVARALFYLDVRYEGDTHSVTGADEPDLVLTDDLDLARASITGRNESVAHMGRLSTLLAWHLEDPVDDRERRHNDAVAGYQGNRNPFVDHPEWVACVFESACEETTRPPPTTSALWINEIHYDNAGADAGEVIEVAGPAGASADGWQLVLYNGASGEPYAVVALAGAFDDQQAGVGTITADVSGVQNGSADGIVLVGPGGDIADAIAYEGDLIAASGPAAGATLHDIGTEESSSTPAGHSLQRIGTGRAADAFFWTGPAPASPGAINTGQTIAQSL